MQSGRLVQSGKNTKNAKNCSTFAVKVLQNCSENCFNKKITTPLFESIQLDQYSIAGQYSPQRKIFPVRFDKGGWVVLIKLEQAKC